MVDVTNVCFDFSGRLTQFSISYLAVRRFKTMIKRTIINIIGSPNGILDLENEYDETLKNIISVSEDMLQIAWKCMKIAPII